jgi:hypothetical protein
VSLQSFGAEDAPASSAAPTAEEIQLQGVVIERPSGFMTVTMEGPRVVLRFFDKDKKAIAPDVHHAIVKFKMTGRRPQNRTLLLGTDGMSLTHGRVLRPPYNFKAFVSLVKDAGGEEVDDEDENAEVAEGERYTVDFP